MKRPNVFAAFLLIILFSFMVMASDPDVRPRAISPGNDMGTAVVDQRCPTFSWTSIDWATGYKVIVFRADSAVMFTYEEISSLQTPVLEKRITGKAFSWTPSSVEGLLPGINYLWYVQAIDEYETEIWSTGKSFRVELPIIPLGIEEQLREKLKEYGLNAEDIKNVFVGAKPQGNGSNDLSKTTNTPGKLTGTENAGYTFYGTGAGATANANGSAFFGAYAGNKNTSTGNNNSFLGHSAGYSNTTGDFNTFSGFEAGYSNTTGGNNTFYGNNAGGLNVSGNYNTFLGNSVGSSNTIGNKNSFFGYFAGQANTTGNNNVALGYGAGQSNVSGINNIALGYQAGFSNTTSENFFLGYFSGRSNTTGWPNMFLGYYSGYENTTSSRNTFIGYFTGRFNNGGNDNSFLGHQAGKDNTTGDYNTFVGSFAGENNTSAGANTFIGYQSGYDNTTGQNNTFVGLNAGQNNTTASYNTFIGRMAGKGNVSGIYNTYLGTQSGVISTGSNNVFLGFNAGYYETGSNKLYIDSSDTSSPLIYGEFDNDLIKINGNFQATGYLSLNSGTNQINSAELNILDGKTLATGTSNNDQLVTKGYVDENDSVGVGLTGSAMTNIYIPKWDDGNTRFVDSIMSEGTGAIYVNGSIGVGTATPSSKIELQTTGELAVFTVNRTDGASFKLASGVSNTQIGTQSNHGVKFTTNNTWKMRLNASGTLDMADGGSYNGTWNDASSIEFKENIQNLTSEEAITALKVLNPVKYNYKKYKDEERVGFIAEHVPEIVANKDRKNLSAMDIVAVLTKVVKEQQKINAEQQKKFEDLEKINIELLKRLEKLEKNK